MKISLIPWELIWILLLILLVIVIFSSIVKQVQQRRLSLKQNLFVYICLLGVIGIPYTVPLLGYRFILSENNIEVVETDHPVTDLQPHIYESYSVNELYEASLTVIQNSRTYGQGWQISFAELEPDYVGRIVVNVPVLWGMDQLNVTIQNQVPGVSRRVFLLSQTTEWTRDFGENARHIKHFYEALDAELAKIR